VARATSFTNAVTVARRLIAARAKTGPRSTNHTG
jgi:hypothetical protein